MDQHESIFFRLPREIRDEIYVHYIRDAQGGYIFESRSKKLRKSIGHPIDLALGYTCKRISQEMYGLALEVNEITFRTMLGSSDHVDQCSTASLYESLLQEQARLHRRMLSWAYTLVSPDIMEKLRQRYPKNQAVNRIEKAIIEDGTEYMEDGYLHDYYTLDYSIEEPILLDLVQILADHPDFVHLTSKEYRPDLRGILNSGDHSGSDSDMITDHHNELDEEELQQLNRPAEYTDRTQQELLKWRPNRWWVPDRVSLEAVTEFIPMSLEPNTFDPSGREFTRKSYFSAAAVAIQFLERISPALRMHLRNVIIEEDNLSIALPGTHAQGLIPFCHENPKLRILRRVDIWRTELITKIDNFGRNDWTRYSLIDIATWIHEAKVLRQMGMPTDSFLLELHGPTPEASQQLSDGVIRAAIWHEGAAEIARHDENDFLYYRDGVAEDFVQVIKEMLKGEIPARFDAVNQGQLWDLKEVLRERKTEWESEIKDVFSLLDLEEPSGGWEAARNELVEEVDCVDRMDGWDSFIATA